MLVLAHASEDQIHLLRDEIDRFGPWVFGEGLDPLVPKVPGLAADDATKVMVALLGAGTYRASSRVSTDEFASDVANSTDLKLDAPQRQILSARLASLLEVPGIVGSAKALDLLSERERVFHASRIISDLRPVFGDEVVASPTAVLITHTLKIEYHGETGREEFYISMDDQDIEQLMGTLERAKVKSDWLVKLSETSGLTVLTPATSSTTEHQVHQ
ncbi:MAG: hypothetical protein WBA31_01750 [Candidatus Dormiibacterota bacterium]